jgi:hypothetical protein
VVTRAEQEYALDLVLERMRQQLKGVRMRVTDWDSGDAKLAELTDGVAAAARAIVETKVCPHLT